jgi:hypothetical protein
MGCTASERLPYVVIERRGRGPSLRGYDQYVTQWDGLAELVEEVLEDIDPGEPVDLRFVVHLWTRAEFDAYVEENGVEIAGQ